MEENKVVTVKSQQSTNIRKPWTMQHPMAEKKPMKSSIFLTCMLNIIV